MKYLRLIDHNGIERHVFQVFVEGQDFEYEFPEPVAIWFGKLQLVDKLPGETEVFEDHTIDDAREDFERDKGVLVEPETVDQGSIGDTGVASPNTLEGFKVTPESSDDRATCKGSKGDKRTKTP